MSVGRSIRGLDLLVRDYRLTSHSREDSSADECHYPEQDDVDDIFLVRHNASTLLIISVVAIIFKKTAFTSRSFNDVK